MQSNAFWEQKTIWCVGCLNLTSSQNAALEISPLTKSSMKFQMVSSAMGPSTMS